MNLKIRERIEKLEMAAHSLIVNLFPADDDNFIHAVVGDHAEQYRHGSGYDVMAALSDSAVSDWADYEPCPTDAPETDEE